MDTSTSSMTTDTLTEKAHARRGCLFYVKRGLKWFGIALIALVLLGATYQIIATEFDRRAYSPRGELYTVNGHQMHIYCAGEGSPTIVLQAGATAESLWWYRVQNQLAGHTRVCAYDRAGLGFSEPAAGLRDGTAIVSELHALLEQADVHPPYIMAGHSFGAVWTRIYAAQYPQEVTGIVMVDSTFLPKQGDLASWKTANDAIQLVLWIPWHIGLMRLSEPAILEQTGYPPDVAREIAALQVRNQTFDTTYAETIGTMESLSAESAVAENLGNLPMIVLWASESDTAKEVLSSFREELAAATTNSVTRLIEGANHGSILGNEQYAQQVSDAILDVMKAAQTHNPLTMK